MVLAEFEKFYHRDALVAFPRSVTNLFFYFHPLCATLFSLFRALSQTSYQYFFRHFPPICIKSLSIFINIFQTCCHFYPIYLFWLFPALCQTICSFSQLTPKSFVVSPHSVTNRLQLFPTMYQIFCHFSPLGPKRLVTFSCSVPSIFFYSPRSAPNIWSLFSALSKACSIVHLSSRQPGGTNCTLTQIPSKSIAEEC